MSDPQSCPICLEPYRDAELLPACGHSFCATCVAALPSSRRRVGGPHEALCPLCRAPHAPGSAVPNWSLRDAALATSAASASGSETEPVAPFSPSSEPEPELLSKLGIPPGLARLAREEARRVGLRLFLLDNSGSTASVDGHVLRDAKRFVTVSRWTEICASAETACALGAATGVPCEFHLLNPLRGELAEVGEEGTDWIRSEGRPSDLGRLQAFLRRAQPGGVTPLAERLRALAPRFSAFRASRSDGRIAFLLLFTDGAPTETHSGRPSATARNAALAELRRLSRAPLNVRLVVRLCTDEDAAVEFWNAADAEEELPLDVLDDLASEAKEIAGVGNGWMAYTPALHALRESGTLTGLLDLLDERRLRPGEAAVLAGLLLDGGEEPLPDWQHERRDFEHALHAKVRHAGTVFDPVRRSFVSLVDERRLLRSLSRRSPDAILCISMAVVAVVVAAAWAAVTSS